MMSWNWISLAIIIGLAVWRAIWLASGVPDTTAIADEIRNRIEYQLGAPHEIAAQTPERWSVSMWELDSSPAQPNSSWELVPIGVDQWDVDLPVWITPGRDGQPGWAGWDDNGNGIADEAAELGAAWSDDHCVVALPGEPQPSGRVIDHGGFRAITTAAARETRRARFNTVYIRDAP